MAMFDLTEGGEDRGYPWDDRGNSGFSVSQPETPQPKPDAGAMQYIPSTPVNPETGFAWNSKEDLAATNKKYGGAAGGQTVEDWLKQYRVGNQATEGLDRTLQGLQASGYKASPYMYGTTPSGNELSINGQKTKLIAGEGSNRTWYDGGNDSGPGGQGNFTGGSIFDDPATTDFMRLLMARVNALNKPYSPPDLGGLTDYLRSYFQKLQGPAYTPQQMDLLQTQSLDPLSRERDAYRQRILENASRRGLDPKSGIVQKMISDADNNFEQIRTKTQAGFASKAVDLDRINAQQAASVGQLLANIEQADFNSNEQRAGQALDTAKMVPDLARQRMLDAQGILSQNSISPTSLLSLSQQGNQYDSQQTQNYILGLAQLLPYLMKSFGG